MNNVVEQMVHPMIEEMQVRYEREIAEIRSDYQDKIETLEGRIDEAEFYVDRQRANLDDVITYAKKLKEEKKPVTLDIIFKQLKDGRKVDSDWSVLDDITEIMKLVDYKVEYRYETKTQVVYEVPQKLKEAIRNLQEYI